MGLWHEMNKHPSHDDLKININVKPSHILLNRLLVALPDLLKHNTKLQNLKKKNTKGWNEKGIR